MTMTKPCKCGKLMIKRHFGLTFFDLPQRSWSWWCGGCGAFEKGGRERAGKSVEGYRQEWEAANAETDTGRTE